MRVQKSLAIALCLSLAAACSKNNGNTAGSDGGVDSYSLAVVAGGSVLTLHPADVRNLKVVLAQANVGPVKNANITFAFDNEDPAGAQLDHPDTTTAADGTASVNLTAGATATFKVIVSAPDYPDVRPVAFSIQVVPVRKLLLIVGSPQVVAARDQQTASVTMYKSSSVALKVLSARSRHAAIRSPATPSPSPSAAPRSSSASAAPPPPAPPCRPAPPAQRRSSSSRER